MIFILGGAGFIGSNFVYKILEKNINEILVIDKLTYAGNLNNIKKIVDKKIKFIKADIGDSNLVMELLKKYNPKLIINFAAETHVDRSIHSPGDFIHTNIVGTFKLLETIRTYLDESKFIHSEFKLIHISTDEVYGSLDDTSSPFLEKSPYRPNSPYAASKASSDHLVRAWHKTYGIPTIITNCSNNYGPYQFPEKLIPLVILNALKGKTLPIYGDGKQIRDWIYVNDHCSAILSIIDKGCVGDVYNIGSGSEKTNLEVVKKICNILDAKKPRSDGKSYQSQIVHVKDRLGHDYRYAIDFSKLITEFSWAPSETFDSGLNKTIDWYIENTPWLESVNDGTYRTWIEKNYRS
jgi:dTDP-glucose 4,6-dehydratase